MAAGLHDQRAKVCDGCLVAADGLLIKHRGGEVPIDGLGVLNAMILDAVMTHECAIVLHGSYSCVWVLKGRSRSSGSRDSVSHAAVIGNYEPGALVMS